jgi:hypothetical protein
VRRGLKGIGQRAEGEERVDEVDTVMREEGRLKRAQE